MRLQYRILKSFDNLELVEVCYLHWMKYPDKDPHSEELRDINSVKWKYMGTLLVPSAKAYLLVTATSTIIP